MSDSAQREWRFYLDDTIGFAEKVIVYTKGLDQDGFARSGLNYDASLRNLELIGEAAPIFRTRFSRPARKYPGES